LVIYHYGGYYADIDTTCIKPLRKLSGPKDTCVIGIDEVRNGKRNQRRKEYLQWFFGAEARHPVMLEIVNVIEERMRKQPCTKNLSQDDRYTLWLTGPRAFTEAIKRYTKKYPKQPITIKDVCYLGGENVFYNKDCLKKAFLLHHYEGSWKKKWNDNNKKWFMPAKHQSIEGFTSQIEKNGKVGYGIGYYNDLNWTDKAYFIALLAIIVATENIHDSIM
jgi:mannosyltransferase OCH1-like enzyme